MNNGIPKKIAKIDFALLSPEEIRKMAATKIITADTYDDDGFPVQLGLMDTHLGVIEPGLRCKTCGRKVNECPGHFGYIDLAMPVIHVNFVKLIKNMLRSTCRRCGRILLSDEQIDFYMKRLKDSLQEGEKTVFDSGSYNEIIKEAVKEASSTLNCPHCGEMQRKITLDKPTTFREDGHKLTPRDVRERLERIGRSDFANDEVALSEKVIHPNDLILEGINPDVALPEWTVLTVLPVPPANVRPSITLDSGERSEDDLTHKLVDVLRINQRLQENRDTGSPQLIVEDLWELLQYHVTTFFDNQTSGIPPARHRSGRPLKTLVQRLKGKEGRFRSNLSGKRVNFSARTVISPDPFMSINNVGVPLSIAKELSVPIRVNKYNIDMLRKMVMKGPEHYPGVNYVIRPDGRRVRITERNAETVAETLDVGFIVERHLIDGDVVLFNRQPSLHRMSMMAHSVKVMPGKTFKLNLCVCPPYNADFDGDEMNLHVPQSVEARAEAKTLMQVQEQILSPRFGGPIIGAIHDHISGAFLMTFKDKKFTKTEALHIMGAVDHKRPLPEPEFIDEDGKEYWIGKQFIEAVIPPEISMKYRASVCSNCDVCVEKDMVRKGLDVYKKFSKKKGATQDEVVREMRKSVRGMCDVDGFVWIMNGRIISGAIDEKSVGSFKGQLLNKIARKLGLDAARKFLDDFTKIAIYGITTLGFSTGIDEEDIPEEAINEIAIIAEKTSKTVDELIQSYENKTLDALPGRSLEETLEVLIMRELGQSRDKAGEIAGEYLGLNNSAVIMAKSGARASMLNLSQMSGMIGQQAVRGSRIQRGYHLRTLPHFKKNELGAEAKGYVKSSYKTGLNPTEYFFHAMGGREGLVDTAVRTSRSGYMQRRLINALEDLKVMSDYTVRNTADAIIQFKYGGDAIDPSKCEKGSAVVVDSAIADVVGVEKMATLESIDISSDSSFGQIEQDLLLVDENMTEDNNDDGDE